MSPAEKQMLHDLADFAMYAAADQLAGSARDALNRLDNELRALANDGRFYKGTAPVYVFEAEPPPA